MHANSAFDRAAAADDVVPLSASRSNLKPARRLSPLVSLITMVLLSLATWAAIWATVASLLAK